MISPFCEWLTRQDESSGMLPRGQVYRLPSDAEWSAGVGLQGEEGTTEREGWQDQAVSVGHSTKTGQKLAAACWGRALLLKIELERPMKFADLEREWTQVLRGLEALQQVEASFEQKRFLLRSQLTDEQPPANQTRERLHSGRNQCLRIDWALGTLVIAGPKVLGFL